MYKLRPTSAHEASYRWLQSIALLWFGGILLRSGSEAIVLLGGLIGSLGSIGFFVYGIWYIPLKRKENSKKHG